MTDNTFFSTTPSFVRSQRIIYTPSPFARTSLIHLQETGTLQATYPHKNERSGISSCLFFTVLSGSGQLTYGGKEYELSTGDCVFIDCKKAYSHSTPASSGGMPSASGSPVLPVDDHSRATSVGDNRHSEESCGTTVENSDTVGMVDNHSSDAADVDGVSSRTAESTLWSLQWCHFYGPNMNAIYRKYMERGGQPMFRTAQLSSYRAILDQLYCLAGSDNYVRDMRIHEKLSSLLILLMEDAWSTEAFTVNTAPSVDIQEVKEYLDSNFKSKITAEDLGTRFYINKYYLMRLFKERYGVTINVYLNQVRVTYIKHQLRFTDKTVEMISAELDIEPTYLSRLFKKLERVTPSEYRKQWNGNRDKN